MNYKYRIILTDFIFESHLKKINKSLSTASVMCSDEWPSLLQTDLTNHWPETCASSQLLSDKRWSTQILMLILTCTVNQRSSYGIKHQIFRRGWTESLDCSLKSDQLIRHHSVMWSVNQTSYSHVIFAVNQCRDQANSEKFILFNFCTKWTKQFQ